MLGHQTIYAIGGWSFSSNIFHTLNSEKLTFIGLEYRSKHFNNITEITHSLASQLKNDAILLGWSFGGLIAMNIASLYPKKIKALILSATQPRFLKTMHWQGISKKVANQFLTLFNLSPARLLKQFDQLISHPGPTKHTLVREPKTKRTDLAYLQMLFQTDLRIAYQKLSCPILHFIHEKDAILPPSPKQLEKLNPNTNFCLIENASHAAMWDQFNIFENHIWTFCNDPKHT